MMLNFNAFQAYCKRSGINLLRDDLNFIQEQLNRIPSERHRIVMRGYCDEWLAEFKLDEKSSLAQNLGRRRANLWLREMCFSRY